MLSCLLFTFLLETFSIYHVDVVGDVSLLLLWLPDDLTGLKRHDKKSVIYQIIRVSVF